MSTVNKITDGVRTEFLAIASSGPNGTAPPNLRHLLIKKARDREAPALHGYFEWDDAKAGEAHRFNQACYLCRKIEVEIIQGPTNDVKKTRYIVDIVPSRQGQPDACKTINEVLEDKELYQQWVDHALKALEGWQRKYEFIVELAPLRGAITRVVKAIRKARVTTRKPKRKIDSNRKPPRPPLPPKKPKK